MNLMGQENVDGRLKKCGIPFVSFSFTFHDQYARRVPWDTTVQGCDSLGGGRFSEVRLLHGSLKTTFIMWL